MAILRWGKDGSVLNPRWSYCYTCNAPIPWYDNIPILSYFLLRGKCRKCKTEFSIRYALIELLTAILFVITAVRFYPISMAETAAGPEILYDFTLLFYLPLVAALVIVTFTDIDEMIVPDVVTYPLFLYGIILAAAVHFFPVLGDGFHVRRLWSQDETILFDIGYPLFEDAWSFFCIDPLYGAIAGGLPLYLIGIFGKMIFRKDAMGLGDVKLMIAIGTILGWRLTLIALAIAVMLGGLIGLALMLMGKAAIGRQIPFGPYLAVASYVCLIWGPELQAGIYWYYIGRFAY